MSTLGAVLRMMLVLLGVAAITDAGLVGIAGSGVIGIAVAAVALAVLAFSLQQSVVQHRHRRAHPRRAIGVSVLLAQSDPDAAGHSRPRAPGVSAAA